jgi:hypothetical protein
MLLFSGAGWAETGICQWNDRQSLEDGNRGQFRRVVSISEAKEMPNLRTCGVKCTFIRSHSHTRCTLPDIVGDLLYTETECLHSTVHKNCDS